MHPRNPYRENPPNFKQLAAKYPDFCQHCVVELSGKVSLDFQDPGAVRELTIALLKEDFGLNVSLPLDSLVPRIPLRINYILWIDDLINQLRSQVASEDMDALWGFDIGTGASCVYPLLGHKLLNWNFVATERNRDAFTSAQLNVAANKLESKISVYEVDENTALSPVIETADRDFAFCMCNPPFYDSLSSPEQSSIRPMRPGPHSSTVAKSDEIFAAGGEVAFVSRIIEDSKKLGNKIKIYTSMVGKKASLGPLKAKLRDAKVCDFCETTFCQGKTFRWALAWTFLPNIKLKVSYDKPAQNKPPLVMPCSSSFSSKISNILDDLKLDYISETLVNDASKCQIYSCTAHYDSWSHSRRNRRAKKRRFNDDDSIDQAADSTPLSAATVDDSPNKSVATSTSDHVSASDREVGDPLLCFVLTVNCVSKNANSNRSCDETAEDVSEGNCNSLSAKPSGEDLRELEFRFCKGRSKDALHQIFQFFKNAANSSAASETQASH